MNRANLIASKVGPAIIAQNHTLANCKKRANRKPRLEVLENHKVLAQFRSGSAYKRTEQHNTRHGAVRSLTAGAVLLPADGFERN